MNADDQLLTTEEVAETLKVGKRYVYDLIRNKQLKVVNFGHRTKRIRQSVLDAFIAQAEATDA